MGSGATVDGTAAALAALGGLGRGDAAYVLGPVEEVGQFRYRCRAKLRVALVLTDELVQFVPCLKPAPDAIRCVGDLRFHLCALHGPTSCPTVMPSRMLRVTLRTIVQHIMPVPQYACA